MITKELIIKSAMKIFLSQGVKTVPLDRLAKDLRTSKRTIYQHFENKTELLKACLADYHKQIKKENQEIIDNSRNAIEAMGHLFQQILLRSSMVNPNFFNDIIHYYPGLLNESYQETGNFAHQQLKDMASWAIKDDIFLADMDTEVATKTVLSLLKLLKDNNQFPVTEYSKERLTFGILLPYMRGLCTEKGQRLLNRQEELYRVSI